MERYETARHVFKAFRDRIAVDTELGQSLESAVVVLRSAYDTAIRENRFVVGGAVEHFLVGAFNGAGLPAQHVGRGDTRIDMVARDPDTAAESGFSIKASFSSMTVRLINTLGGGTSAHWTDPTLFLLSGVGLVYADPELLPNATKQDRDALVLEGKHLKEFIIKHPEYVIPLRFEKPKKGKIPSSRTASEDVARTILKNFNRLVLP